MDDAFVGVFGEGHPVVGILAEYDALGNMNQKSGCTEKCQTEPGRAGHGCQHNLLGAGAVAGAVGVKTYMEKQGIKGTVKLFGCPAEESGYGKAFMARDGVFDGVDAMLTWHPMDTTAVWDCSSLAVLQAYFHFRGVSSHAGSAPELGRSALDAAELMNVGVNFLREHIIDEGRIHYAFTDVGGQSANVVQPTASLYYFMRAPKTAQAQAIYNRVVKVAQGAATMTETELEVEFNAACANYLPNRVLNDVMYQNLQMALPQFTQADFAYAQPFFDQLPEEARQAYKQKLRATWPQMPESELDTLAKRPLSTGVPPMTYPAAPTKGSSDVGDASWLAPTAQVTVATAPSGTPAHSWQWVAVGKSAIAHKGMLAAGKTIAYTALDLLQQPDIVKAAQKEHETALQAEPYTNAIPKDVLPQ